MPTYQEHEPHLREALSRLYDPAYQPSESLCALVNCGHPCSGERVRAAILEAIESLRPAPDTPPGAQAVRVYEILTLRYVRRLTQEETAQHLGISARYLRRQQRLAIGVLAERLRLHQGRTAAPPSSPADEWRQQVRHELALLQGSAPGATADVGEVLTGIVELARPLAARYHIALRQTPVAANLGAAIPASSLRQATLGCLTELARHVPHGEIEVAAAQEGGHVQITITGSPASGPQPTLDYLIQELLAMHGGSFQVHVQGNRVKCRLELPSTDRVTVLVIDDNPDLVHLYKRYVEGTRYQIVSASEGERNLEAIAARTPDIVVLDLMLPDADGWELLVHLHEHPATRSIPVVVCSVVRAEELSLALGAAVHVSKPVGPQQFLQALEQALASGF